MKISIIIPAYNEEKRLPRTLRKIKEFLKKKDWDWEIVVVDDGSSDSSARIARKEGAKVLRKEKNEGKGAAVKEGMLQAEGDFLFFTDADLSTPVEEIERFIPYLEDRYDIVIGSRALPDSQIIVHQNWGREKMGKIFNFLVRLFFSLPYRDTQCGFKGFRREVAKDIFSQLQTPGFSFDVEVLILAKERGYRVKELGVQWANSSESRVKIFSSPLSMLKELLILKWKRKK